MIFDSPKLQSLRKKYADTSIHQVPGIIQLYRLDSLENERVYLENLISAVSPEKQKKWLGSLLDTNWGQHLGAWFEIMLFGWLRQIGKVEVEPEIEGNFPDFSLEVDNQTIISEARAWLVSEENRMSESFVFELLDTLKQIPLSYMLLIEQCKLNSLPDLLHLIDSVTKWLQIEPDSEFTYQDKKNNHILLKAQRQNISEHVETIGPTSMLWVNPDKLRPPLGKEAKQHRRLRKSCYPYVIAIFIESPLYEAEDVVSAWFGQEQFVIDVEKNEVVESKLNHKGLHFWQQEIRRKSVSGTLVFRANWDRSKKLRYLNAWYVDNPYANRPIDPFVFPVTAAYTALEKTPKEYKMGWKRNQNN